MGLDLSAVAGNRYFYNNLFLKEPFLMSTYNYKYFIFFLAVQTRQLQQCHGLVVQRFQGFF